MRILLIKEFRCHNFGDRVNAIVDNVSSTFSSFVKTNTPTDKLLINDERIQVC
jgi:hypothetical protein